MKVVGYADRWSVQQGQVIRFMVSCELPQYSANIVKLIHGDVNPKGPGFKERPVQTPVNGQYRGFRQEIKKGSYVEVAHSTPLGEVRSFTIQAWVWPTTPKKGVQGLVTKWVSSNRSGYSLVIDDAGDLALWIGTGDGNIEEVRTGKAMRDHEWYFVAASYDAIEGKVWLVQQPLSRQPKDESRVELEKSVKIKPGTNAAPLLVGAFTQKVDPSGYVAGGFYNGKIENPRIYGQALKAKALETLRSGASPPDTNGAALIAWDFSVDISSTRVTDTSPNGLHGNTVNMPMRGVTGHNWTGREQSFNHAKHEYGAIYFHDDDLADAGWKVGFELSVPENMKSGVYAAHLKAGDEEDYVPFFVRPRRGTASSKIAFLAPTLSYYAYANEHMMLEEKSRGIMDLPADYKYPVQLQDKYVVEQGLNSLYDLHTDGSGVCYSTRLRPWVNMRPKYVMTQLVRGKGSPHQFNADLHLIDWLEAKGFEYDVITDEDLHHEGAGLLQPYRVILGGTHHEYWSEQMLDAMEAYLNNGGRFMNLAGNGYYWVTAIDPTQPGIVEIRRWGGTQTWEAAPGESYLSTTGEMGGLWRNRNRAPQKWLGAGFTAEGFDRGSPYRRQPGSFDLRAAFIFEGIGKDELIGDFTNLVMEHGAAGFEIDRADHLLGTPSHTLVLATATDFSDNYQFVIEEVLCADSKQSASVNPGVKGDIVFLEYPNGGGVFSASSISWCGCLHYNNYDNNVSRMTENVLRRFMSDKAL